MIDYELGADGIAVVAWNMVERSMNVLNDASVARFAALSRRRSRIPPSKASSSPRRSATSSPAPI